MTQAHKYARAFFDVVMDHEALDIVIYEFEALVESIRRYPEWIHIMTSPSLHWKEKKKMVSRLGDFHPLFLRFIHVLIEHGVFNEYETIYEEWQILSRREQKIAYVRLYVAKPLSKEQVMIIQEELETWLEGMTVEMEIIIDKRLIGGIRIVYQGQTIDRSFYNELQELKSFI